MIRALTILPCARGGWQTRSNTLFSRPMKLTLSLLFAGLILLQAGCAFGPTIDEQAHEETQQHQVEKRSDAFARTLQQ